ncbi:ribosome small subunit-dependent GTPase A [Pelistega ratti]|uniref:ribosome small subunit-dependent GTPase A n=1 Tax=Pelistega ratti TaxID=2652177 RepID=UPI001359417B|nr:ribosome small subunit-dependent GTPase A [Pelistega ratti]
MQGRVITAYGRHFTVKLEDGSTRQSFTKGKKTGVCVGDYVRLVLQGQEEARIEEVLPRQNLLYRSDEMRSKQFAANVDLLCIVVAVQPTFSEDLLSRALVGAWSANIEPIILLNKIDLQQDYLHAKARLAVFADLGVKIIEISTLQANDLKQKLIPLLSHKTSLLLGQSAMGKSSILNVLIPYAQAHTQEHSIALGTGKHTTTTTCLYELPEYQLSIIDSPGFQSFGLKHLSLQEVIQGFPEFLPYIDYCRFYNCTHLHEPGCGVLQAIAENHISPKRHEMYERILMECTAPEKY